MLVLLNIDQQHTFTNKNVFPTRAVLMTSLHK